MEKTAKTTKTKSQKAILATARALLKKYGIKKITVEEICEEAEVSKMTFYRFYKNKVHLVEDVLDELYEKDRKKYRAIMAQKISFAKKMQKIILLRSKETEGVSSEFLNDIYNNTNKRLKKRLEYHNQVNISDFIKDLEQAQENGEIKQDLKPELVLYMIGKLTESLTDKELLAMYDSPQDAFMAITNYFFKGIGVK